MNDSLSPPPALLDRIGQIYPEARQTVESELSVQASDAHAPFAWWYYPSRRNPGAFCLIDRPDYRIAYLSFEKDLTDPTITAEIRSQLQAALPVEGIDEGKEFYFNIYGRNVQAIRMAQALGFHTDMAGFRLRYNGPTAIRLANTGLAERGFEPEHMDQFADLFDRAYYDTNVANGWPVDWHTRYSMAFEVRLKMMDSAGGVRSFWDGSRLVGAYLIQGIYISDLAVHPDFQNQGYGRALLLHALDHMLNELGLQEARLNVARTNTRAQRFYKRNHFIEIGCFADHTYLPPR